MDSLSHNCALGQPKDRRVMGDDDDDEMTTMRNGKKQARSETGICCLLRCYCYPESNQSLPKIGAFHEPL